MTTVRILLVVGVLSALAVAATVGRAGEITADGGRLRLVAGTLERTIDLASPGKAVTSAITVSGKPVLAAPAAEALAAFSFAEPNRRPDSFKPGAGAELKSEATFRLDRNLPPTHARYDDAALGQTARWVTPVSFNAADAETAFGPATHRIAAEPGLKHLTIAIPAKADGPLAGVTVELHYAVYDAHPAIRKWVAVRNGGTRWLKIDRLTIDPLDLAKNLPGRTALAPADYGVQSSVVAFSAADESFGVIAASEVPSGLRWLGDDGRLGYHPDWFEWVLAPGETFESEPVFLYAFAGAVEKTASAVSRPLDRAVEGPYMAFVRTCIGVAADTSPLDVPTWISWARFGPKIDEPLIRRQADVAAQAGFVTFQIDDGWQRDRLGTEPNAKTFPTFDDMCKTIQSKGLKLGLWVSCFRNADSKDLKAVPDGRVVPFVRRLTGYGMGFAGPWRTYYIDDLIDMHKRLGVAYVKQDFSNLLYGDVAAGHEGRTPKDSILRSLRRLLEVQDELRRRAPGLVPELTHEIIWNTPGPAADLAVVRHAARYHISPNACVSGAKHVAVMYASCLQARQRFYAHRGLPLYALEFYGAASGNYNGGLTPAILDREVASWLMGTPSVYSGDLSTLTPENIAQFRKRFDALKRLQAAYDIYRHFQFSGVPAPTDDDWHWWGKLSDRGGAVVVLRGKGGPDKRAVNIPWVQADRTYRLIALFADRPLGTFTGRQLQDGGLVMELPVHGQEIVEVVPAS